jgi:hypothetical protein
MPTPRVRAKYPHDFPWTLSAKAAYRADPSCHLVIEHTEPLSLVMDDLLLLDHPEPVDIADLLHQRLSLAVVMTPEEHRLLTEAGLRQRMPEGWRPGDDPMARYRAAGLDPESFRPLRP